MATCKPGKLQEFAAQDDCSDEASCSCTITDIKYSGSSACWGITSGMNLNTVFNQVLSRAIIDRGTLTEDEDCDCSTEWIAMDDEGAIQLCGDFEKGVGTGFQWSGDDLRIFSDDGEVILEEKVFLNSGLRLLTSDAYSPAPSTPTLALEDNRVYYPFEISSDMDVYLPVGVEGKMYVLARMDASTTALLKITPSSGQYVEYTSIYYLKPKESVFLLYTDGGTGNITKQWKIIARHWQPLGSDTTTPAPPAGTSVVDKRLIGLTTHNFLLFVDGILQIMDIDFSFASSTGTITYLSAIPGGLNQRLVIL